MALCGYDDIRVEGFMGLFMLTNRLDATVFGFAPDVIFSVDSAAKRAVAISGVSAGIGLVLDFWYQFLHHGTTVAQFQVGSNSRTVIALFHTDR